MPYFQVVTECLDCGHKHPNDTIEYNGPKQQPMLDDLYPGPSIRDIRSDCPACVSANRFVHHVRYGIRQVPQPGK